MKQEQTVRYDSVFEGIAHRVIHPFGQLLKSVSPMGYESARWELAKWWGINRIISNPMTQHFLLPFVVRKGDTVLDIGANTGQFTIPLAHLVGPSGMVHSFEPITATFNELKESVEQEKLSGRVRLCKLALGDSAQEVSFTVPKGRPTEATLVPHDTQKWTDYDSEPENYIHETCRVVLLDDFVRENGIGKISFLKCDVEGGELGVMQGAKSILSGATPPIVMAEIYEGWTKSFGYEPRDLIRFLEQAGGYECYWINPLGLKRVKSDDRTIPGVFYQWVDFLFIVPNVHKDRINVERYISE